MRKRLSAEEVRTRHFRVTSDRLSIDLHCKVNCVLKLLCTGLYNLEKLLEVDRRNIQIQVLPDY